MPRIYNIILILIIWVVNNGILLATHNRAGEITYKNIGGFTFEVTITTYTYRWSPANRDALEISWGDGTTEVIELSSPPLILENDYLFNTYTGIHTFPGAGIYQITMEDPNRNLGVKNIPNSVVTVFSIKSTLVISPFTGSNSTPVLLNPPIDKAAKGHVFVHNPSAYDSDGDSISYVLTVCTAENGNPIENYEFPESSDTLFVNPTTGDLVWANPVDTGIYNIAIYVDEWRNGVKIGRILRDMQVDVYETDNNPPVNEPIIDYCVEAGETVEIEIRTTDEDNDSIKLEMTGGPLNQGKASFNIESKDLGITTGRFTWNTDCQFARNQPYTFVLKSQDNASPISLVDITSFTVKIIHSPPENLIALPGTDTIRLEWGKSSCGNAIGYRVYRRIGSYGFVADSCETGVPAYTGFELISEINDKNATYFTDNNNGSGLVPGFDYCYMITAFYGDNAESIASNEICATLIAGIPSILQVSVENIDEIDGNILVSWAVPKGVDTIDDGPYRYEVYRLAPDETNYILIATIPSTDLTDTTYLDQNINTLVYPYFYRVILYYENDFNEWIEIAGNETASSLYIELTGKDNKIEIDLLKRAPWFNYEYHIFRRKETSPDFDSIATTTEPFYTDAGLKNGEIYSYKTTSLSTRPLHGTNYYSVNKSHIASGAAIDTFPPCEPNLSVISVCDSSFNLLTWERPVNICGDDDVVSYQIFYRPTLEGSFTLLGTLPEPTAQYKHDENLETLSAVYGIAAVDSFNNVSNVATAIIDSCTLFDLPNVFSPNDDGVNDIYYSLNIAGFNREVKMKIFNRYGSLVYETTNPDIAWDGTNMKTKKRVSSGVYYYICDVTEPRIKGMVHRTLKGFIHVFSGENAIRVE